MVATGREMPTPTTVGRSAPFSSFPRPKTVLRHFVPLPDPVRQFQPEVHSETVVQSLATFQQCPAFSLERLASVFLSLSSSLKEAVMLATGEYESKITPRDHVRTSAPDRQRT